MSAIFQTQAVQPISISVNPVAAIRAAFAATMVAVRAAAERAVTPSYAERHAKDVDIVSTSRVHGYSRDGVTWSDIGYRS